MQLSEEVLILPPSTQSHPSEAQVSSLRPCSLRLQECCRESQAKASSSPLHFYLFLAEEECSHTPGLQALLFASSCPQTRAVCLPSPSWHRVVSAISHDFKKRLGPQLCHGPSLVLQHLKHTQSLSPWTHVNMVVFSTGSLAW